MEDRSINLVIKELIRMKIKPNYAALGREYECDYRKAKKIYQEELMKESSIEIPKKARKHLIDDYKEIIDEKLKLPGMKANSIFYFLRVEKGYLGKYGTIRDYVKTRKKEIPCKATIRVVPIIGKSAQVDWKEDFKLVNKQGELFVINIFLLRLHYSKKFYTTITIDKKQDEVKKCIVEAIEYFGCMPREIWFDNMRTIVIIERIGDNIVKKIKPDFKIFATDMGFNPITCQSRRAKTKGTVENLAKICDRLLSYNNEFETLEDLFKIIETFNKECGLEKSQAHNKIVDEMFEKEKEYLLPLPNSNICQKYKEKIRYLKVSSESMITYLGNKYSVPTRFINSYLGVRIIEDQVIIYDNTEMIRCHKITEEKLNYNDEDKLEILKSDLLFGKTDEEIQTIINREDLQIYDFLKEGVN